MKFITLIGLLAALLPRLLWADTIRDEGKFFSESAKKNLSAKIADIAGKTSPPQRIFIVTRDKVAGNLEQTVKDAAPSAGAEGLYVFISREPKKLLLIPSKGFKTRISSAQLEAVRAEILAQFRADKFELGLSQGIDQLAPFLLQEFSPALAHEASPFWHKALTIIALLLGALGIFRLLAYLRRPRPSLSPYGQQGRSWNNPQGGYNQPQGGGYPPQGGPSFGGGNGGGGGGMLQSMFGGIAGAVAGNWMYDKFFGNNQAHGASPEHFSPPHPVVPPEASDNGAGTWDFNENAGDYSANDDWSSGGDSSSDSSSDSDW
jgi:uncharacterized protein